VQAAAFCVLIKSAFVGKKALNFNKDVCPSIDQIYIKQEKVKKRFLKITAGQRCISTWAHAIKTTKVKQQ
jgi:hypothetical protein